MTCSYSKEFSASAFTGVENAFVTEYLPIASGDAVKVYLYGLFLCQNPNKDQSLEEIASTLNFSQEKILSFFAFWEEFGLVSVVSKDPLAVHYFPIRSSCSTKPRKIKAEKYSEFTKGIQALISERMISTGEYTEYFSVMETYSIKPEAMLMIVKYCIDLKGQSISYRYILKVAKDFGTRGITTIEKVEKELSSYLAKTSEIGKILSALGVKRLPDYDDSVLLKKWTQELDFEPDSIIFAAGKLKKGNMAKLDTFLNELYSMKCFSPSEITEFVDKKQAVYDLTIKINKALSIYVEVLDTVIDTYTNKWLSYGFDAQALLLIANHCFKQGKNTLQDMDELVGELRGRGFVTVSGVGDYFESQKQADEFIKKFLLTAGINRRPNAWDRENLNVWKTWNFTEEMILQAGKLSAGKSSPIAYANGILSKWKSDGVFNIDAISEVAVTSLDNSQETYNQEYERRRTLAHSRAQKNMETAMAIEGFSGVYGKLNSMEKDLAFAELSNNQQALIQLEEKQKNYLAQVENLLKSANLTISDLSPQFACKKCNDTGYVGTHRCDCFNKKI